VLNFLLLLVLLVVVLWFVGVWLGSGEDLSVYDGPVEPSGVESFSNPKGPSSGHQGAEAAIAAVGPQLKGLSSGERLKFVREYMEEMPSGKEFNAEFKTVDVNGVRCEWVLAPGIDDRRRVLYLHGGAFIAGSPLSHRSITTRFSEVARAAVLAVDYRLMPENRRMDGIEDCRTAYRWILENGPAGRGEVSRLFMGGDSAGGNYSLVTAAWVRDLGLRAPDAVVAFSPLTDSTYSGPSITGNLHSDTMLRPLFEALTRIPKPVLSWIFLFQNRMRQVNPLVSPLLGDLSGLPPMLLQASESEMLFDDARRYVKKARAAGSPAKLQSWADLLHVWQMFYPEVPEAGQSWDRIAEFLESVEADLA